MLISETKIHEPKYEVKCPHCANEFSLYEDSETIEELRKALQAVRGISMSIDSSFMGELSPQYVWEVAAKIQQVVDQALL